MSVSADQDVDKIAEKIIAEIEHIQPKELVKSKQMIKTLHLTTPSTVKELMEHAEERNESKKAVAKILLYSAWNSRLYFIIRSAIMGLLGALFIFIFVLIFHSITLTLAIPEGIFSFIFSLAISRLLDVQIVRATRIIVDYLSTHKTLRTFVLNHF
jgi:hypothetical protein